LTKLRKSYRFESELVDKLQLISRFLTQEQEIPGIKFNDTDTLRYLISTFYNLQVPEEFKRKD
jgi:hypothetical protein